MLRNIFIFFIRAILIAIAFFNLLIFFLIGAFTLLVYKAIYSWRLNGKTIYSEKINNLKEKFKTHKNYSNYKHRFNFKDKDTTFKDAEFKKKK